MVESESEGENGNILISGPLLTISVFIFASLLRAPTLLLAT